VNSIDDYGCRSCTRLADAIFLGNAPAMGSQVFDSVASGFKVGFFNGKSGFTAPTWNGYPAVNMGDPTPTATWLVANGLAHNADLRSDPNGDGVSLLMAYALNLDPNRNLVASMPKPALAGNQMSLTFYAGTVDVTYAVESSTDLQHWSTNGVTVSGPDGNHIRTATIPTTDTSRFRRLVVSH
jgi:hypothetical protein